MNQITKPIWPSYTSDCVMRKKHAMNFIYDLGYGYKNRL